MVANHNLPGIFYIIFMAFFLVLMIFENGNFHGLLLQLPSPYRCKGEISDGSNCLARTIAKAKYRRNSPSFMYRTSSSIAQALSGEWQGHCCYGAQDPRFCLVSYVRPPRPPMHPAPTRAPPISEFLLAERQISDPRNHPYQTPATSTSTSTSR